METWHVLSTSLYKENNVTNDFEAIVASYESQLMTEHNVLQQLTTTATWLTFRRVLYLKITYASKNFMFLVHIINSKLYCVFERPTTKYYQLNAPVHSNTFSFDGTFSPRLIPNIMLLSVFYIPNWRF